LNSLKNISLILKTGLSFFLTAEELEENEIQLNPAEQENFESEFKNFWTEFENDCLGRKPKKSFWEKTKDFLNEGFVLRTASVFGFLLSFFLYLDNFWNSASIIRKFFPEFAGTDGMYFARIPERLYQEDLLLMNVILFSAVFSIFIYTAVSSMLIYGRRFLLNSTLIVLSLTGVVFSVYCDLNSRSLIPELLSLFYLLTGVYSIHRSFKER